MSSTRLARGRSDFGTSKPLMAMWTSLLAGVPGRGQHRDRRPEGRAPVLGQRIVVGEVVDHLLDAHGLLRRQLRRIERPAHERIGGAVDIDREGRHRLARHALDRVRGRPSEAVAPVLGCLGQSSEQLVADLTLVRKLSRGSEPYQCLLFARLLTAGRNWRLLWKHCDLWSFSDGRGHVTLAFRFRRRGYAGRRRARRLCGWLGNDPLRRCRHGRRVWGLIWRDPRYRRHWDLLRFHRRGDLVLADVARKPVDVEQQRVVQVLGRGRRRVQRDPGYRMRSRGLRIQRYGFDCSRSCLRRWNGFRQGRHLLALLLRPLILGLHPVHGLLPQQSDTL